MPASLLQSTLFASGPQTLVDDVQGGVFYRPGVIDPGLAAQWFVALRDGIDWQSMRRPMYDRVVDVPRMVASHRLDSTELLHPLGDIAHCVRAELGQPFNAVGLNYYRDERTASRPRRRFMPADALARRIRRSVHEANVQSVLPASTAALAPGG